MIKMALDHIANHFYKEAYTQRSIHHTYTSIQRRVREKTKIQEIPNPALLPG